MKIIPLDKSVELERIKELINGSPDIREDMVFEMRNRVFRGTYSVEAEQIAEKIMQQGLYVLGEVGLG